MDVRVEADCGNAPKKAQVRDWLIAVSERRVADVVASVEDDVTWELLGSASAAGRDEVARWLDGSADRSLHIRSLISHGNQIAAETTVVDQAGQTSHLAHVVVYRGFSKSARIKTIRTYRVPAIPVR